MPCIKYETALFFCDNLTNREEKEKHFVTVSEILLAKKQRIETHDSDIGSTFDDSDKDKDYNPTSSSSDSDDAIVAITTKKRKAPTLLHSSPYKKVSLLEK